MNRALFSFVLFVMLAACGGNDSRSQTNNQPQSPSVPFGTVPAQSGYASATRALRKHLLDETSVPLDASSRTFLDNTANERIIIEGDVSAYAPTKDTNAQEAWRQGWTGRGVRVGHLDDFQDRDIDRQFHCGTGLPWSDAAPHLRRSNVATFGQLTVNWRF